MSALHTDQADSKESSARDNSADSPKSAAHVESQDSSAGEEGEIVGASQTATDAENNNATVVQTQPKNTDPDQSTEKTYYWCKCPCDPTQYAGVTYYYLHLQTSESRWEEPDEPYWLFDSATGRPDPTKLQQPKHKTVAKADDRDDGDKKTAEGAAKQPSSDYQGYNPRIHGKYDPTAPYAKYHENKRKEEEAAEYRQKYGTDPPSSDDYAVAATFNRVTGAFQTADKSVERHSDASKSHRQLSAFYDVDAAANTHQGQSLKAARQQQKYTKKEIAEMNARRKEKKMKKRLDWLKS